MGRLTARGGNWAVFVCLFFLDAITPTPVSILESFQVALRPTRFAIFYLHSMCILPRCIFLNCFKRHSCQIY